MIPHEVIVLYANADASLQMATLFVLFWLGLSS